VKGLARVALFVLSALCFGSLGTSYAVPLDRVDIGALAPAFSAKGADGRQYRLHDYAGKLVVLEWTSPVCPFTAAKYKSGAMQALQHYAASHNIIWLSINTAAPNRAGYLTAAQARARITQTGARVSGFLFDVDGSIARRYGAKTTPSFFIVDREGKLAYEGAMDDDIFDNTGKGHDYIQPALEDLLSNRPVRDAQTQPQGCAIEY
jgi:hypothetical protein